MKPQRKSEYTLKEIADGLDVGLNIKIQGDPHCVITGVSTIQQAQSGKITFLTNSQYRKYLTETKASAVILSEKDAASCPTNAVISHNPYFTYAKIASLFLPEGNHCLGVHPSAIVGESCEIDASASIGAHCVIGNNVKIGANVIINSGCVIGDYSVISDAAILDANVTVYDRIKIGKRTHLSSGVVIGGDGFGFANQKGEWHKIPQLGGVVIGDDVDIGANTSVDRGAIEDTVIENGVKIDNLVQIGHNVRIGEHTIISGCVGVAGSATIGSRCMIGGASCINGHITICDNVIITGSTGVEKSITEPGMYSSGIVGVVPFREFRRNNARFHRLEGLVDRVKALESELKELKERNES